MRLGAPIRATHSPEEWISELKRKGYRAAYCPLDADAPDALTAEYRQAALENDIVIAEVGVWNNMLTPDPGMRARNLERNVRLLQLADRIGARCCVNVSGNPTSDAEWDCYFPGYDSEATYELVARTMQRIIDEAQPRTACFTLECMQWMLPDSTDSCERLLRDVDRERFGVHFDPVNLINSPRRYEHNGEYIADFIARLGQRICSCHLKDVILRRERMLVHLEETPAGTGALDYGALLSGISALDQDMPVMLEHLPELADYDRAAAHVRAQAAKLGIAL